MQSFYTFDGDAYHASELTRGPWDDRLQHGGPPLALLTGALARFEGADRYALTRVDATFAGAVPIGPVRVEVRPVHLGRTVQRLEATLSADGRVLLSARAQRTIRGTSEPSPGPSWTHPDDAEPLAFSFFRNPVGYHRAVELKTAEGRWGTTPIKVWGRSIGLVEGRETGPYERTAILVDAQSGMGPPADPQRWTFVNPEVSVTFARPPRGAWIGLEIRAFTGHEGHALTQSLLCDRDGWFGGASQTMIVSRREPDGG